MNSTDIVGWTSPAGYALCTDCVSEEGDLHPIFADSEWDSYPTCDHCNQAIEDVNLTSYGLQQQWLNKHNKKMRKVLDENNGKFPSFTELGMYPLYYVDDENNTLCPDCANKQDMSSTVTDSDVNWEDEEMYCDDCNKHIVSAYGDDTEDKE